MAGLRLKANPTQRATVLCVRNFCSRDTPNSRTSSGSLTLPTTNYSTRDCLSTGSIAPLHPGLDAGALPAPTCRRAHQAYRPWSSVWAPTALGRSCTGTGCSPVGAARGTGGLPPSRSAACTPESLSAKWSTWEAEPGGTLLGRARAGATLPSGSHRSSLDRLHAAQGRRSQRGAPAHDRQARGEPGPGLPAAGRRPRAPAPPSLSPPQSVSH